MMAPFPATGTPRMQAARAENRSLIVSVAVFSAAVNLLMLTGPLFMLQVCDRVPSARSSETLLAMFILVMGLFAAMGVLDYVRTRIMVRVGARLQTRMEGPVFAAALQRGTTHANDPAARSALRDLDAISRLFGSPAFTALFDAPRGRSCSSRQSVSFIRGWGCWPLGGPYSAGRNMGKSADNSPAYRCNADRLADQLREEADIPGALGMRASAFRRWQSAREVAAQHALGTADMGDGFSAFTRTFRLFLQSAMLALGAWVVPRAGMTPGAMIAASILMGHPWTSMPPTSLAG